MPVRIARWTCAALAALALAACGDYRPGVSGQVPVMQQNLPSNAMPQPAGSLGR